MTSRFGWHDGGQPPNIDPEAFTTVMCCKICAAVEGVRRCKRCQAVAYCGKAHQRQDWPAHKAGCVSLREIDGSRGPVAAEAVQPRSRSTQDTQGVEEEPNEDTNTLREWSSSGIFEADNGAPCEFSKEDVLAYLMSGNGDEEGSP